MERKRGSVAGRGTEGSLLAWRAKNGARGRRQRSWRRVRERNMHRRFLWRDRASTMTTHFLNKFCSNHPNVRPLSQNECTRRKRKHGRRRDCMSSQFRSEIKRKIKTIRCGVYFQAKWIGWKHMKTVLLLAFSQRNRRGWRWRRGNNKSVKRILRFQVTLLFFCSRVLFLLSHFVTLTDSPRKCLPVSHLFHVLLDQKKMALFLTNLSSGSPHPSFFEMIAQDKLITGLKPALKYLFEVCLSFFLLLLRFPASAAIFLFSLELVSGSTSFFLQRLCSMEWWNFLLDSPRFRTAFLVWIWSTQSSSLCVCASLLLFFLFLWILCAVDSSFAENFFGLKRIRVDQFGFLPPSRDVRSLPLHDSHRWIALFFLVCYTLLFTMAFTLKSLVVRSAFLIFEVDSNGFTTNSLTAWMQMNLPPTILNP